MKTADEHQRIYDEWAQSPASVEEPALPFLAWRSLVLDYRALEIGYAHLLAVVLRLAEIGQQDEDHEVALQTLYDKAIRIGSGVWDDTQARLATLQEVLEAIRRYASVDVLPWLKPRDS